MRKKLFSLALIGIFGLVVTNFGTKVDAATRSYGNGVKTNLICILRGINSFPRKSCVTQ